MDIITPGAFNYHVILKVFESLASWMGARCNLGGEMRVYFCMFLKLLLQSLEEGKSTFRNIDSTQPLFMDFSSQAFIFPFLLFLNALGQFSSDCFIAPIRLTFLVLLMISAAFGVFNLHFYGS